MNSSNSETKHLSKVFIQNQQINVIKFAAYKGIMLEKNQCSSASPNTTVSIMDILQVRSPLKNRVTDIVSLNSLK